MHFMIKITITENSMFSQIRSNNNSNNLVALNTATEKLLKLLFTLRDVLIMQFGHNRKAKSTMIT